MRIDDPKLKGKLVLSYNENTKSWEYKKVLRWLVRGIKETLVIKTSNHLIRCTKNHLIRTDQGWIKAGNVKEGMKILSPANVDVEQTFINTAQMEEYADFRQDISLGAINTGASLITLAKLLDKQKLHNLYVNADVTKNWIFPTFSKKKAKALKVSNLTGKGIHTEKVMESGICGDKISLTPLNNYKALSHKKDLHGGIWMTALSNLVQKEVLLYFFTLKGFLNQKIKLLLIGLRIWDILPVQNLIQENPHKKLTTTLSLSLIHI